MIKRAISTAESAISSAARLSLAPARLAGRVAGSVVRELRGTDTERQRRSAPAKPTSRSRARAQPRRAPQRARARGQAKPATTRTPAKPQAKRPPRRKPLDDAAIARKVESTIFEGVAFDPGDVDVQVVEGVVSLRGEVPTWQLINQLEARATRLAEVRRVENLLRVRERPTPSRVETPGPPPETARPAGRPEHHERTPSGERGSVPPVRSTSGTAGPGPEPPERGGSDDRDESEQR